MNALRQVSQYATSCCSGVTLNDVKNSVKSLGQRVASAVYNFFSSGAQMICSGLRQGKDLAVAGFNVLKVQYNKLPVAGKVAVGLAAAGTFLWGTAKALSSYYPTKKCDQSVSCGKENVTTTEVNMNEVNLKAVADTAALNAPASEEAPK